MQVKLDLEVLLDDVIIDDNVYLTDSVIKKLTIKFLNIDDRFQIFNCTTKHQLYLDSNGMKIICSEEAPDGKLSYQAIVLPYMSHLGKELSLSFFDDDVRKEYLKKLYDSLKNWGNNWWGFDKDSYTYISVNANRWTVFCQEKNIYNESTLK